MAQHTLHLLAAAAPSGGIGGIGADMYIARRQRHHHQRFSRLFHLIRRHKRGPQDGRSEREASAASYRCRSAALARFRGCAESDPSDAVIGWLVGNRLCTRTHDENSDSWTLAWMAARRVLTFSFQFSEPTTTSRYDCPELCCRILSVRCNSPRRHWPPCRA